MDANQIDPAVKHRHVQQLDYTVPRLTLPITAVSEFQKRYETTVPGLPVAAVADLVSRRAPWSDMVELIERSAPHGFLIYFRNEVHPVMALAGDRADCVAYLMGNHIATSATAGGRPTEPATRLARRAKEGSWRHV